MALTDDLRDYTKSGQERMASMIDSLVQIEQHGIEGDVVECGIWRGGNIVLARKYAPSRLCWLYDTFTGMTMPTENDMSQTVKPKYADKPLEEWVGHAAVSVAEVREVLKQFDVLDDDKLRFVVGDVCETLKTTRPEKIALLRLDTDWYASTAAELHWLYPLLVPGGFMIVDDFGHWPGARRAVLEYFRGTVRMERIDYTAIRIRK